MESAMGTATTLTTPQDQVEALMVEVAEENGLEIMDQLQDLKAPSTSVRESAEAKKEDDLTRRYYFFSYLFVMVFEVPVNNFSFMLL